MQFIILSKTKFYNYFMQLIGRHLQLDAELKNVAHVHISFFYSYLKIKSFNITTTKKKLKYSSIKKKIYIKSYL